MNYWGMHHLSVDVSLQHSLGNLEVVSGHVCEAFDGFHNSCGGLTSLLRSDLGSSQILWDEMPKNKHRCLMSLLMTFVLDSNVFGGSKEIRSPYGPLLIDFEPTWLHRREFDCILHVPQTTLPFFMTVHHRITHFFILASRLTRSCQLSGTHFRQSFPRSRGGLDNSQQQKHFLGYTTFEQQQHQ